MIRERKNISKLGNDRYERFPFYDRSFSLSVYIILELLIFHEKSFKDISVLFPCLYLILLQVFPLILKEKCVKNQRNP